MRVIGITLMLLLFCNFFTEATVLEYDEWEDQPAWALWRIYWPRTVPLLRAELLFTCGSQEIRVLVREGLYVLTRLNESVCPAEQMQAIKLSASEPTIIAKVLTSLNNLLLYQTAVSLTGLPTREVWTSAAFRDMYCGTGNIAVTLSSKLLSGSLPPAAEVFDATECLETWKRHHMLTGQKPQMPKWARRAKSWLVSEAVLLYAHVSTDIQASSVVLGGITCEEATSQTAIEWQAFFSHFPVLEQLWFRTPFTALDKYQMLYYVISGLIQSVHDEPLKLQIFSSYDPHDPTLPLFLQDLPPLLPQPQQQCIFEQSSSAFPPFFFSKVAEEGGIVRDCWNWSGVRGYNKWAGSLAVDLLETFPQLVRVNFSSFDDLFSDNDIDNEEEEESSRDGSSSSDSSSSGKSNNNNILAAPLKCTSRLLNAVLAGPIKFSPNLKLIPVQCFHDEPSISCQQWIRAGLCVDFISFDMKATYWRCSGQISFSSYQEECHRVHFPVGNVPKKEKIDWFSSFVAPQISTLQLLEQECSNPFFPCLHNILHLHNFSSLVELEIGSLPFLSSTDQIQGLASSASTLKRITFSNPFLHTFARHDLLWSPLSELSISKAIVPINTSTTSTVTATVAASSFPLVSPPPPSPPPPLIITTGIQFPVFTNVIEINLDGSQLSAPCLFFQHFPRLRQLRLTVGNTNHSIGVKCHTPYVEILLPKPILGAENASYTFDFTCLPPPPLPPPPPSPPPVASPIPKKTEPDNSTGDNNSDANSTDNTNDTNTNTSSNNNSSSSNNNRNNININNNSNTIMRSGICIQFNTSSNIHTILKDSVFWREEPPMRFMCRTEFLNLSKLLLDDVGLTTLFARKHLVPDTEGKPQPINCVNHSIDLSHNNITTLPAYILGSIFTQVIAASNPIMRLNFSMNKDTQTSRLLKYSPLTHLDISMCPVCYINFIPNVHFRRLQNVTLVPRPPLSTLTYFWGSKNGCPSNQSMPFGLHFWNRVQQNSTEDANLCVELSREIETSANYRITPNRGLMVLGDSCAGKTSTIAKLVNSSAGCTERADRTITMETGLLELDVSEGGVMNKSQTCDERLSCVVLRYHDTGGQLRYRAYQPSFMSDENVFLILFDSTLLLTSMTSAVSQRLWHWVRHITDSTEGVPAIFIVANFMERTLWSNSGPPRKEFIDQILLGMNEIASSLTTQPDLFSFHGLYLLDVCSSEKSYDLLQTRYDQLKKNFTNKIPPFKFTFQDLRKDLHSYLNSVPTAVSLYYSAIAPCLRELLSTSKPWNKDRVSKVLPSEFYLSACGFSTANWEKEQQIKWNSKHIWPHIMDKQTFLFLINYLYIGDAADKKREAIGESVADDVIRYLHDTGEILIPFLQNVHNRTGYRASHARIADDATVVLNSQFIARGLEEMVQDVNRGVMGFSRQAFWAYFSDYVPEILQPELEATILDFLAHDIAIKTRSSLFLPSTIVLSPSEYDNSIHLPTEFYMVPSLLPDYICEGECENFGLSSRLPPEYTFFLHTNNTSEEKEEIVCIHTACLLAKLHSNSLVQANWISFLQYLLKDVSNESDLIELEVAGYQVKFAVFDHLVDVFWAKKPTLSPNASSIANKTDAATTAATAISSTISLFSSLLEDEGEPEDENQEQSTQQQQSPLSSPFLSPLSSSQSSSSSSLPSSLPFEGLVRVLFDEQHNRVLFGDISFHLSSSPFSNNNINNNKNDDNMSASHNNNHNASEILLLLLAAVKKTSQINKQADFLPFKHPKKEKKEQEKNQKHFISSYFHTFNFDAREAAHTLLKGTSPPTLEQLSLQRNEAFDQGCPMLEDEHARIFTLATSVQTRSPDVVVIFVHGLNGNALNTWEHYDPARGEFFVWPRDFLPQAAQFFYATAYTRHDSISSMKLTDLLNVEVISLSYHNHVSGHKDFDCRKIGEQFSLLLSSRHLENVPLIWVGHDMGGLAIECILTHAAKEIKEQSVLSVFFGVPHQGSIVTRLSGVIFFVIFLVIVVLVLALLLAIVPNDDGEKNWRNTFLKFNRKNINFISLRAFLIAVAFLAPGRLYWSMVCRPGPRFSPYTCNEEPWRDLLLLAPYGVSVLVMISLRLGMKYVLGLCLFSGSMFLTSIQFGSYLFLLLLFSVLPPVCAIVAQACLLLIFFCWFVGLHFLFEMYVRLQDLVVAYVVFLVIPFFRSWPIKNKSNTDSNNNNNNNNNINNNELLPQPTPRTPANTADPQPHQFWQAIANNVVSNAWTLLSFNWILILVLYPLVGNLRHRVRRRKIAFALWLPAVYFLVMCLLYVSFHSKLSLLSSPTHIREDYLKSLNVSGIELGHECFFFETKSDFGLDAIFPPVTKEEAVPKDKADSPWLKIFNGTAPHFEMVKYSRRDFRFPKMPPGSRRLEDAFATWKAVRLCLTDPVCKSLPPVLVARWVADAVHNFWIRKGVGGSPADECRGPLDPRK